MAHDVSSLRSHFKPLARTQFDDWAERYDRSILHHFLFRPAYVAILEEIARWRLHHPGDFRLLDVGCGTGALAGLLARGGWPIHYVGLDYSPVMCATARAKTVAADETEHVTFLGGDSEHLPVADQSFDLIACANSFHHYPDQRAVLREMRRVLRPGGRLILIDGFRDNAVGWVIFDALVARLEGGVHHAPWHELRTHFAAVGFNRIQQRKISFLFPLVVTTGGV